LVSDQSAGHAEICFFSLPRLLSDKLQFVDIGY